MLNYDLKDLNLAAEETQAFSYQNMFDEEEDRHHKTDWEKDSFFYIKSTTSFNYCIESVFPI